MIRMRIVGGSRPLQIGWQEIAFLGEYELNEAANRIERGPTRSIVGGKCGRFMEGVLLGSLFRRHRTPVTQE